MMSDGMLSQDEIDALLNGTGEDEEEQVVIEQPPVEDYLSALEQDTLGEIGNISFGSSATALSSLLNQKVEITTPTTKIVKRSLLPNEFPQPNVAVQVTYTEGFSGMNLLVIQQADAAIIADLMLGGDGTSPSDELSEIHLSAVQEAMNQMMGSSATSMSTVFNKRVDISPPSIDLLNIKQGEGTETIPNDDVLVKVSFQLKVGDLIDSKIMQLLPVEFAKQLVEDLLNPPLDQTSEEPIEPHTIQGEPWQSQQHTQEEHQTAAHQTQYLGGMHKEQASTIQPAEFSSFHPVELGNQEQRNLNMLLDIPLKVTVELGRTKRTIKDILDLSSGSVVELDKLAGEPVDILVNEKPIAKGEVVVIDENFGVRVTDILSQKDRLKTIQ
ncbi:flagellar motor switch phosphatase FliY [Pontibacillus litoralis]|uniref:Flagellar motor switch protein FliN n=1 Tax=Pontibacillus litoralis JSM 072002 TaxID=1385512 RepID=A0A0A5GB71_9BACI|nr:flagellar motor switch phosphatase FliY [Pontibacillus litoralis]KGX88438.1 flagellar motor switch protein FliN [Pontibacillus litoralis JSM 072002]